MFIFTCHHGDYLLKFFPALKKGSTWVKHDLGTLPLLPVWTWTPWIFQTQKVILRFFLKEWHMTLTFWLLHLSKGKMWQRDIKFFWDPRRALEKLVVYKTLVSCLNRCVLVYKLLQAGIRGRESRTFWSNSVHVWTCCIFHMKYLMATLQLLVVNGAMCVVYKTMVVGWL